MSLTVAVGLCLILLGIVAAANTRGGLRDRATHRIHRRDRVPYLSSCGICHKPKRTGGNT